jgi:hypothetical protein
MLSDNKKIKSDSSNIQYPPITHDKGVNRTFFEAFVFDIFNELLFAHSKRGNRGGTKYEVIFCLFLKKQLLFMIFIFLLFTGCNSNTIKKNEYYGKEPKPSI